MTASIAHEIKQPLAAIVTNANAGSRWLNRQNPELGEARIALDQIAKAGMRITDVIDSIRSMFGQTSAVTSPVDVCELVNGVLALCQGELEAHGILLCREMHDALPEVMAAHMQLQQVVLNLIMNAVEAMSAIIGRDRCLTITAKPEGKSSVMIGIEDTGTGIDPVYLDRILSHSSPPNRKAWAWGSPSADPLSRPTAAGLRCHHDAHSARAFS